jgi:hypothetical protein
MRNSFPLVGGGPCPITDISFHFILFLEQSHDYRVHMNVNESINFHKLAPRPITLTECKGKVVPVLNVLSTMPWRRMLSWEYKIIFSTSALDGRWSASRPGRFITGERVHCTHWIEYWMGPSFGLKSVEKSTISFYRESIVDLPFFTILTELTRLLLSPLHSLSECTNR